MGCDSSLRVLLSELMAAERIDGFLNGQEATGRVSSVSIYKLQQYAGKSEGVGGEKKKKILID